MVLVNLIAAIKYGKYKQGFLIMVAQNKVENFSMKLINNFFTNQPKILQTIHNY